MEDGETWCDTSVNGNGRVLQIAQQQSECDDPSLVPDTVTPCVDVGKGWGVCDAAVRLPSRGFEYDADMLKGILRMSPQQLFAKYPGCGTLPLMVRSNRAGRHGGGLFQVRDKKSRMAVSLSFILSLARYNTYIFFCSNMGCGSYYLSS